MTTQTRTRHLAEGRVGARLAGKWQLDALLGYGGSAAVYAATHRNGKRAAIKVLHPHAAADEQLRLRFIREGYVANKIAHPGAVSVLDDDVAPDGTVYLVMELLEGTSLERLGRGDVPPLTLPETVRVVEALLDVLTHAHAVGVVHRDIKPANLFVTNDGVLKVLDFGIARLAEPALEGATQTGLMMGTPAFMPPEQARARWSEVDARSDVWAVGATMIALLLGHRPRVAETANEELLAAMTQPLPPAAVMVPGLPTEIAHVIDIAVRFNREERWPSAAAMAEALRAAARMPPSERIILGSSQAWPALAPAPGTVVSTVALPAERTGPPTTPSRSAFPHYAEVAPDTNQAVLHSMRPPTRSSSAGKLLLAAAAVLLVAGLAGGGAWYARGRTAPATAARTAEPPPPAAEPPPPAAVEPPPASEAPEPPKVEARPDAGASKPASRPRPAGSTNPAKYFDSRF